MAGYAKQLIIGGYAFGIETAGLESLDRDRGYRWPSQARVARPSAHQFVGADEDTITISGYIHPHFKGTASEMDKIADLANQGIPHMVTDGTGKVFGRYVIVSIKDARKAMMDDARPRRVDFTVTLKRYGEDG